MDGMSDSCSLIVFPALTRPSISVFLFCVSTFFTSTLQALLACFRFVYCIVPIVTLPSSNFRDGVCSSRLAML